MSDPERRLTALVLEDEALIAMDLAMQLEDLGVAVMGPYTTAPRALEALQQGLPDLALLDFNLNGHTSEALALRMIEEGVPVAIITGQALRHLPAALEGATVLQKPLEIAALRTFLTGLTDDPTTGFEA